MIVHPIAPIYNNDSKILILGSFPSVKSREECFYYSHPQNRFWKLLSIIFNVELSNSIDEKRAFLLNNNIALWDVVRSCEIKGSADSSIKIVTPNDISVILDNSKIELIVLNGRASEKYYKRFLKESIAVPSIYMPSTSPANAGCSLDDLVNEWKIILNILNK